MLKTVSCLTHFSPSAVKYESSDENLDLEILNWLFFNGASPRSSGVRQSIDALKTFQRLSDSTR